jgi:hypothetical protein
MNEPAARWSMTFEEAHKAIRAELNRLKAAIGHESRVSPEFLAACLLSADRVRARLGGICDLIASYPRMEGIIPRPPDLAGIRNGIKNGVSLAGKTAQEQADILNDGEEEALRARARERRKPHPGRPARPSKVKTA